MSEQSSNKLLSQMKQTTADGRPIEIRPTYYNTRPLLKYQPILTAIGYSKDSFEKECIEAWKELHHQFCAPLTHAVKYLWRAGKKGESEQQDVVKARFWLSESLETIQSMQLASSEPAMTLRWMLPTPRMLQDALVLIDALIQGEQS